MLMQAILCTSVKALMPDQGMQQPKLQSEQAKDFLIEKMDQAFTRGKAY